MAVQSDEKAPLNNHNETNPIIERAEKPCPARIFGKRKSSIVSDTFVSKLSNLFGPSGETRTRGILVPNQAPYQLGHTRICNCPPQNHGTSLILYHRCRIVNNIYLTETAIFLDVPQYQPKDTFLSCPLKFFFTFFAVYGKT